MPTAEIGPFFIAELATRSFFRDGFEIALAGSTGREEQQHGARFVRLVVESVDPPFWHKEKIASLRIEPPCSVEQSQRAGQNEERLRYRPMEMRVRPSRMRLGIPSVEAELPARGGAGGQILHGR